MNSTSIAADPLRVDMSPEAIDRRLRDVAQLCRLGMALRDVKWLGPVVVPPLSSGAKELSAQQGHTAGS